MTNGAQHGGGTFVHLVGSLAEGVFGLAFTMVLVRIISQEDFGAWRQYLSLATIGWNIAIFGMPASLVYFFSIAKPEEKGAIARRTLWLTLVLGTCATVVFFFGLGIAADRFDNPLLAQEALLFCSYFALGFPLYIIAPILVASDQRTVLAKMRCTLSLLKLASLLILVWLSADLHTLMIALNGFAILQFITILYLYLRAAGPVQGPLWQNFRAQFDFSKHISLQNSAGQLAAETDKMLVSASHSPADFAAYSVGARELPFVQLIPYSITDSIVPNLSRFAARQEYDDFFLLLHTWVKRVALIMYPIFALVLFRNREIVTVLYTSDYSEAAIPMLIIGCLIPLRVTSHYQILMTLGGSRDVMFASFAMLTSIAGLSFLFMNMFGPWGAALGVAISEFVVNGAVIIRVAKRTGVGIRRVLPWGFLAKLLVVSVSCGALALPVAGILPAVPVFWSLAFYGVVALVLYIATIISVGLISKEDVALLRRKLRL